MRNNLVPEKRLDKHQKLVTRYVKAGDEELSADLSAAKPTITPKTDPVLVRLADIINDKDNELKLEYLSQESLAEMKGIAEHLTQERDVSVIWKIMNPMLSNSTNTVVEDDLKGLLKHHRLQEGVPLIDTLSAVRGLWSYEFQKHDEEPLSDSMKQMLVDVVTTVMPIFEFKSGAYDIPPELDDESYVHGLDNYYSFFGGDIENNHSGESYIRNEDFLNVVKDHPDKYDQILAAIREHETISPQVIRAVIETNGHSSLLEGAL